MILLKINNIIGKNNLMIIVIADLQSKDTVFFFSHFRRPSRSELPTNLTSSGRSSGGVRGGGSELQRVKLIFDQCYVVIIIIII